MYLGLESPPAPALPVEAVRFVTPPVIACVCVVLSVWIVCVCKISPTGLIVIPVGTFLVFDKNIFKSPNTAPGPLFPPPAV